MIRSWCCAINGTLWNEQEDYNWWYVSCAFLSPIKRKSTAKIDVLLGRARPSTTTVTPYSSDGQEVNNLPEEYVCSGESLVPRGPTLQSDNSLWFGSSKGCSYSQHSGWGQFFMPGGERRCFTYKMMWQMTSMQSLLSWCPSECDLLFVQLFQDSAELTHYDFHFRNSPGFTRNEFSADEFSKKFAKHILESWQDNE